MIEDLLSALLAAIDGLVEAAGEEDREGVELYSGYVRAMMWKITAQWAQMVGTMEAVAKEPYPDSDLESLLTTLRVQAQAVLSRVKDE